jgi:hypothetical protein
MAARSTDRWGVCPLSQRERAGVRAVPSRLRRQASLTLTLSRREREEPAYPTVKGEGMRAAGRGSTLPCDAALA